MKITVVTVCFNAAKELEDTILSVLGQDYADLEYIIIDGGSTDGSVDIIKKYADRLAYWISEPDKGIYDAMNKGIAAATGDYINFMNAGDRFASPTVLSHISSNIADALPGLIYGDYYYIRKEGMELKKPLSVNDMWKRVISCHQAIFFANRGDKILYDTTYKIAADFELCTRIHYSYHWPLKYIAIPVCIYAGNGISEHNPKSKSEISKVAAQYIPWYKRFPYFMYNNTYDTFAHWVHIKLGDKVFSTIAEIKNKLIGREKQFRQCN